jgi:hypothetical protein
VLTKRLGMLEVCGELLCLDLDPVPVDKKSPEKLVRGGTDNFERPGPELGDTPVGRMPWLEITGAFTISNPTGAAGSVRTTTADSQNPMVVVDTWTYNVVVGATVSPDGGDAVYVRVSDSGTWVRAKVEHRQDIVQTDGGYDEWVVDVEGYFDWVIDQPGYYVRTHTGDLHGARCADEWHDPNLEGSPGDVFILAVTDKGKSPPPGDPPYGSPFCPKSGTHPGYLRAGWSTNPPGELCCFGNYPWENKFFSGWNGTTPVFTDVWVEPTYKEVWVPEQGHFEYIAPSFADVDVWNLVLEQSVGGTVSEIGRVGLDAGPTRIQVVANGEQFTVSSDRVGTLSRTVAGFAGTRHGIGRGPSPRAGTNLDDFVVSPVR